MNEIVYDMIYLLGCGVNECKAAETIVRNYKGEENRKKLEMLHEVCRAHFVDALTGTVLKRAGVRLPVQWEESIAKAIRKVILFDAERTKIFSFMDQKRIWHMPLKGVILKEFYPSIGMRQMSDNDILFDADYASEVHDYMESQGYETVAYGRGNHDVYEKTPVYNFEMHTALYGASHREAWVQYYQDIRSRLVPDTESGYACHMRDEDFYVYIISHAYKHYSSSGTGVRTLLDFYAYLQKKETMLDFEYIHTECKKLGIEEFEEKSRRLCKDIFLPESNAQYAEKRQFLLDEEAKTMLWYYISSGVYGTKKQQIENQLQTYREKNRKSAKLQYIWNRLFPGMEVYRHYPFSKHKWTLPLCWVYRCLCVLSDKTRRAGVKQEAKLLKKIE